LQLSEERLPLPNGSWVEFFSTDSEQKLRGRKRDILFVNEANELNFIEWQQLKMRDNAAVHCLLQPLVYRRTLALPPEQGREEKAHSGHQYPSRKEIPGKRRGGNCQDAEIPDLHYEKQLQCD
jgi:hypothetical protein